MSFRFGKRFGSSKTLKASSEEPHRKAWAHLGIYRGSHHVFREQSLVEFLTDHPEQCKDLTDKEAEDIRRGCILLNDALAGRASHGLHSLLDDAAWKRVLFKIQTADWWQNVVITASFVHAGLVFLEAPNWKASRADAALEHWSLALAEMTIIAIYASDVIMKMLYFGGWSDYVSKEWQRNYVLFIFLFSLDLGLFKLGVSDLRFSRPIRLLVVAGRHRDVRRLVSTIPKMCTRLIRTFAIPLFSSLGFFAILVHRFYGSLPEDQQPELGSDHFGHVLSCMRALFVLSTLSNFDPVVINTYVMHPWSAMFFMAFMITCGFFLMSVALGVVYDIYIDDHECTVTSEQKKEGKSMDKCFKKLDLSKTGLLDWRLFAEMMEHLRAHDLDHIHNYLIFREIAIVDNDTANPKGLVGVDQHAFSNLQDWVSVTFMRIDLKNQANMQWWATFEFRMILCDAALVLCSVDDLHLLSPIQFGDVQVSLLSGIHVWLLFKYYTSFMQSMRDGWRLLDLVILYSGLVAQMINSSCVNNVSTTATVCQTPYVQVLNVVSALRLARVALHYEPSRHYLLTVGQIAPVLAHFGSLVLCFVYFAAVVSMEMLAKEPIFKTQAQTCGYLGQCASQPHTAQPLQYLKGCKDRPPAFDCPTSALLSMFMMFTGTNWHDIAYVSEPMTNNHGVYWNTLVICYFFGCYVVLGIILCNLLTTLIVEFHKVVEDEQEPVRKIIRRSQDDDDDDDDSGGLGQNKMRGLAKFKSAVRAVEMANKMGAVPSRQQAREDVTEIMVGKKQNWRRRLSHVTSGGNSQVKVEKADHKHDGNEGRDVTKKQGTGTLKQGSTSETIDACVKKEPSGSRGLDAISEHSSEGAL